MLSIAAVTNYHNPSLNLYRCLEWVFDKYLTEGRKIPGLGSEGLDIAARLKTLGRKGTWVNRSTSWRLGLFWANLHENPWDASANSLGLPTLGTSESSELISAFPFPLYTVSHFYSFLYHFFIKVCLIYNIVSYVKQSDSVFIFWLFSVTGYCKIYSSLSYIVNPCCLSIPCIIVSVCSSHSLSLSLLTFPFPFDNPKFVFCLSDSVSVYRFISIFSILYISYAIKFVWLP